MMNKYIIYPSIAVTILILITIIFYLKKPEPEHQTKIKQKSPQKIELNQENNSPEIIYDESLKIVEESKTTQNNQHIETKQPIQQQDENFVQNINTFDTADMYNFQLEEKTITLSSTTDNKSNYSISLKSSQKITSVLPKGTYILLNGTLEHHGEKSKFSLSFNEHYKEYTQYSFIEVTHKQTNTVARCDGSFLGGILPNYRYFITLELSGDTLLCYINSQEEDNYENENRFTKELNISNTKLPPIKEGTPNGLFQKNQLQGKIDGNSN